MSKPRWTPRKYNATDLKHRQRLLMLVDLCVAADLLLAWALLRERWMLMLGLAALILAFVSRSDNREEMNGNLRITLVAVVFLFLIVFLTLCRRFFWIVGLAEAVLLVLFALWPYRKRFLNIRKNR